MFQFPQEIRRAVYTTNAIESVQFSLRKVTKTRAAFPNDEAALKLLWFGLQNAEKKMDKCGLANWSLALNQLAIIFDGRVPIAGLTEKSFTQKI